MMEMEAKRLHVWLPAAIVAVLLVLAFVVAERIRGNTAQGKFNRIQLGMSQERVYELLGTPAINRGTLDEWHWPEDRLTIMVWFNEAGCVHSKTLTTYRPVLDLDLLMSHRVIAPGEWYVQPGDPSP